MASRTLCEWLTWQESLNPAEIELGLERMDRLLGELQVSPPAGGVFTVAGTNGKGSCATALEYLLRQSGRRTALYRSPHLVRYNERICIDGQRAGDADIIAAFDKIEALRAETPLTFFEYGTLAAFSIFSARACDAWVLEVGLGGRLDAVNAVAADFGIITTVGLDHQAWLGDTVEQIAREKAGIVRAGKPLFYGERVVPESVQAAVLDAGASLHCLGADFNYSSDAGSWSWSGQTTKLAGLELPPGGGPGSGQEQLRNLSVALAAAEHFDSDIVADQSTLTKLAADASLPGRFQLFADAHHWIFDVAHNPQAAAALAAKLPLTGDTPLTVVIAMQDDKDAAAFASELAPQAQQWIACGIAGYRGSSAAELRERLEQVVAGRIETADSVAAALSLARHQTAPGGRILVCGSFLLVGPVLEMLGLYS